MKKRKLLMSQQKRKRKQSLGKPIIVWTMDDANLTDYEVAQPLFESYGVKGTSFAITSRRGGRYCTWEQLKELQEKDNWDVQCHTHNHLYLTELSELEVRNEFETVDTLFEENDLQKPTITAYPFGDNNLFVREIGYEYRKIQRLTGRFDDGLNVREDIISDPHGIVRAMSVDMQDDDHLEEIKTTISKGIADKRIIILYSHQVKQEPDDYLYSIHLEQMEKLLSFIQQTGVETMTMTELYEELL